MRCVVGQPLRCRPVETSPTPSVSTIYIVVSIREQSQASRGTFFALSVQIPRSRPNSTIGARLRRPFAPLPPRPAVGQRPRPLMPGLEPATAGPQPPRGRAWTAHADTRCRCSPPLTCAPAAQRRRVGARPRMTRCRGPLRHSVRRPVGRPPAGGPRTGPSAA